MIKPPALKPGDTIGIMAPSSRVDGDALAKACQWLENYGFKLKIHPQTFAHHHQSAGTAAEKISAFHDLVEDSQVNAIMAARGGNRSGLLLSHLDYALIARNPKPFIGYSDTTAMLNAIYRKTGLVTFHGPSMTSFVNGTEEKHLNLAFYIMAGMTTDLPMWGTMVARQGSAEGRLVGGNLSLISSLMGTVWEPDFEGAILFLEDAADQLSRYDRMLIQLRNAGVFDKVAAVMFGDFSMADDRGAIPFDFSFEEILHDIMETIKVPVVTNAPFGHGTNNITLPLGIKATLEAEADREVNLKLAESPVVKA